MLGREAQRTYLKVLTRRPSTGERPLPARLPHPVDLRSRDYWDQRLDGGLGWLFGYAFKVPPAFYALAVHLPADERAALEEHLVAIMAAS